MEYIKKIYNIDISEYKDEFKNRYDHNYDVFTYFNEKYYKNEIQEDNRKYFNKVTRKKFIKFYKKNIENLEVHVFDQCINLFAIATDYHHIFPLQYGGTNDLQNLIALIPPHHKVLHKNPLEDIEKYCYQAIDYLYYLWHGKCKEITKKYNLMFYKDDEEYRLKMINMAIENEMKYFYKLITKEHITKNEEVLI